MSDKISDERLIEWRENIQWLNSPIPELREFAEVQASAIDELLSRRAAEAKPICVRQAIANMEHHEYCDSINVAYKHGWNDAIKAAGGTVEGDNG
ncbi:hypothetical protein LLP99_17215 [Rouxiella badensis]|uniref:hypothetical protein n=1 Tax=Rouxiella badensis TaxID=1646377 RepID=UPI001D13993C|nr:hypothetical protein [Rouxiella badensis]MCC3717933.1 hypothetical protein [Rouxiella badensis]MCC3730052.1 hypothetical protein [Rouxiella badensis]